MTRSTRCDDSVGGSRTDAHSARRCLKREFRLEKRSPQPEQQSGTSKLVVFAASASGRRGGDGHTPIQAPPLQVGRGRQDARRGADRGRTGQHTRDRKFAKKNSKDPFPHPYYDRGIIAHPARRVCTQQQRAHGASAAGKGQQRAEERLKPALCSWCWLTRGRLGSATAPPDSSSGFTERSL